jgi:ATP-dependent Lhr-like helicase
MKLPSTLDTWFTARFPGGFSQIQKAALPHTLSGANTLILAPTGSGKTLAAFLSILARFAVMGKLPNATCAVYVSPLRSLNRDIERNLTGPLAAVNATRGEDPVRMEIRTGDTDFSDRARMQRKRPHLLLTTPESLSALLSQAGWRDGFTPFAAVVDEVHAFAENKRGSLLALTLERLAAHATGSAGLQRIGLSATAHPVEAVQQLLCGARPCRIASVPIAKVHKLEVARVPDDVKLPAAGYTPYKVATVIADLIQSAKCTLAFTATRSAAERLGLALKVLLPEQEDLIEVHHASVNREMRLRIEDGLATGTMKAVVCSSSLELGVDFQAVDQVILVGCPRGVSRAMQRLGRAGHRVDGVATGSLVPLSLPDLLQCIALKEAARGGRLDILRPPAGPLDVLAQVLLGMAVEKPWTLEDAFTLVRQAGPYLDLSRADFDSVIEYLAGGGKVLGPYGSYGKILLGDDGAFRVASRKVAQSYYMNIGTISDEFHVKVVAKGNRHLGEVEESFIASLQPGEGFVIGGKSVRVRTMHQNMAMVEPAQGERVKTPRWMGGKMSLTARLAQEEIRLRRGLRDAADPVAYLKREWKVDASTARRAAAFVDRQVRASALPVDAPVQLETLQQGRALLLIFHVIAGRGVNRSLAWVTGSRLAATFGERGGSVVANFDDHAFLLSIDARHTPTEAALRAAFAPEGFLADLNDALRKTETLGRKFRPIAETAQLLARRTTKGPAQKRSASWSGALLYQTFQQYEPEHPLLREAVREVLMDELDAEAAHAEAARIHAAPWETFRLETPSPFSLPLFAEFNREVLLAQDPDRALDDLVEALYDQWQ